MSGSQPWVLRDRLDWQGTDQFSGTDQIGYPDGCVARKRPLTIKEKKQRDGEARTGDSAYGFIPARKGKFLFGGYYSLDRCPLMGTNVRFE